MGCTASPEIGFPALFAASEFDGTPGLPSCFTTNYEFTPELCSFKCGKCEVAAKRRNLGIFVKQLDSVGVTEPAVFFFSSLARHTGAVLSLQQPAPGSPS